MALADELAYTTVAELAGRIRRRTLSPVEVLEATIERIEARNPSINALVHLGFDDARAAARRAERALIAGDELGPLHGIPTALKDLFDFKPGWPATFGGIPALRDFVVDARCAFAERAEQAGAIVVGKGNAPALGLRGTTDNALFGPTSNPFDTTRNSGGSSGGCAAAVADGPVTFAEGTDRGRFGPNSCAMVRRLRLQAFVRPHAAARPAERLRPHLTVHRPCAAIPPAYASHTRRTTMSSPSTGASPRSWPMPSVPSRPPAHTSSGSDPQRLTGQEPRRRQHRRSE